MRNSQFAQTARGRAVQAQNSGPRVQNGIATIGGVPYVLTNLGAIGSDNRSDNMDRYAQEFQTRAASNLNGQGRSTALGVPAIGAPRTGQWVPVSSLTPEFYARNYEKNWKNTPGYRPIVTPELRAALASGDPNKIAAAHYTALHTLPKKGQDFGSALLDVAPQIVLGAVPGVGPALAAAYGGIKGGIEGGPLAGILGAASGWGAGNLIPGIQAAGGISNYLTNGISNVTGFLTNPSSALSGATSGAASNPFSTAVDVVGNVPQSWVNNRPTQKPPASTTPPSRPASMNPASSSFVGPRRQTTTTPAPTPPRVGLPAANTQTVRRADGGPISDPMNPMGDVSRAMNPMGVTTAPGYGLEGLRALARGGTTAGGTVEGYLDGPGDGMSDSIKATIDGKQPARLADGEFVIPADVVSGLGNGSSKAGAKVLYAMMDRVRQARTGTTKQGKEIAPQKFLPA